MSAPPAALPSPSVTPAGFTPAHAPALPRSRWLLLPAAWAVPALLGAAETLAFWRMAGRDYAVWRAFATQMPQWGVYLLLTPAIFALGRRLPLRGRWRVRNGAAHLLAALAAGALYAAAATAASLAFSPFPQTRGVGSMWVSWYLSALPLAVLTWFGVVGVGYALTYFAETRRREIEAAQLQAQLVEARLGALRMQLHPHFLFNSLNAVTVLARDGDQAGVVRMLENLSALLREVLRSDRAHEVPLAEELAFVQRYLDIEQVRFSDRLRVTIAVDDRLLGERVPFLLLQPLVENALRHGIAHRAAAGRLEIGARAGADGAALELWVQDDGVGLPADWSGADDHGTGLRNTAARLAQLHGERARLALLPLPEGGTRAEVRLPRGTRPAA